MNTSLPTLTDDNWDEFFEALYATGEEVFSINLLDANPDVAAQVAVGTFEVSIHKLVFDGVDCWVAMADDGAVAEADADSDYIRFAETQPGARAIANEFIMDWKQAWGVAL